MMLGNFISVKDIIENCSDVEYMTNDLSKASDLYGWDPNRDNCSDIIPCFTEGFMMKNGTPCIKLTFNGNPHTRDGQEKWQY